VSDATDSFFHALPFTVAAATFFAASKDQTGDEQKRARRGAFP